MPVHKNVEPGGEKYVAFGLSKLRQLVKEAAQRGGFANRQITTDDGFQISLSVAGDQYHLHITGSAVKYEFFTSDHILRVVPGDPGDVYISSPGYSEDEVPDGRARVVGSLTRMVGKSARPVYSHTIAATNEGDPGSWRMASPLELLEWDSPASGYPISWGSWQFQKMFEHVWWPNNGNNAIVTSTQAIAPGRNSQCNDMSPFKTFRLANPDAFVSDYGLDVPPTYVDSKGHKGTGMVFDSPYVWYRRAAVQKGYMILTDNVGRFHVFPVQHTSSLSPGQYRTVTPPYPAWVSLPEVGTYLALTQYWTWQFNKDATKCVACPFHAELSFFYKTVPDRTSNGAVYGSHPAASISGREDIPGLVEFGIEIVPGGSGDPMDFEVEFTLLRTDYAGTGGKFYFDAAYSLPDVNGTMGVPEDTLVTSEIEIMTTAVPGWSEFAQINVAAPGDPPELADVQHAVGPIRAEYVMNAYPGDDLTPTEIRRFTLLQYAEGMCFYTYDGWAAAGFPYTGSILQYTMSPVEYTPTPLPAYDTFVISYLNAIELRNMSIAYSSDDFRKGTHKQVLAAYNKTIVDSTSSMFPPVAELVPEYDTPVPAKLVYVFNNVLDQVLNTRWGNGFSIHPQGHWSCYLSNEGSAYVDIIQPFKKPQTTHKAVFNSAFGQSRGYDYYWLYSNNGRFFDSTVPSPAFDMGSFRTNGVWITF